MLNFLKGKRNKNDKESNRVITTKIQKINTDELNKAQSQNKASKKVKFEIEVEYHSREWKIDRTLDEFVNLRQNLHKQNKGNVAPFTLLPYGNTSSKHKDKKFAFSQKSKSNRSVASMGDLANAEAPFLREMRSALDTWLETIGLDPDLHSSSYLSSFLDWQRHKSVSQAPLELDIQQQNKKKTVTVDDFVLLKVLGKGSFGKVLLVRKSDDKKIYAMKTLRKQRVFQRHQVEHTQTERRVLGYLKHPFLVSLHYAFQTDQKLFLVLDYAAGGELFFHLSKAGRFTEERTKFYIAEIVLALEYLHSKDIIYRDLKPENILLDSEGHVLITDFGLCKENVPDNHTARSFCGTPEYLAPEILRKVGHGKAADWWTLGALIYEMLCGVPPFYSRSRDKLFEKILKQKIRFPNYFSHNSKDIIRLLMQRNPKSRLGAREGSSEVKVHIFFSGIDWDRLYNREIEPPFRPRLNKDKHGVAGGANFDPEFTGMPIHSPDDSKRKFAPFDNFTFLGHDDDFVLGGNNNNNNNNNNININIVNNNNGNSNNNGKNMKDDSKYDN